MQFNEDLVIKLATALCVAEGKDPFATVYDEEETKHMTLMYVPQWMNFAKCAREHVIAAAVIAEYNNTPVP